MGEVRAEIAIELPPDRAEALWTDLRRWPSFVDGFGRVLEVDPEWPEPSSKLVWESRRGGRGRVTERVRERHAGVIVSVVYEEQLSGTQTVSFAGDGRARIALEYELTKANRLTDWLFVRRLLRQSLERTLGRFAVEAAEEASL